MRQPLPPRRGGGGGIEHHATPQDEGKYRARRGALGITDRACFRLVLARLVRLHESVLMSETEKPSLSVFLSLSCTEAEVAHCTGYYYLGERKTPFPPVAVAMNFEPLLRESAGYGIYDLGG